MTEMTSNQALTLVWSMIYPSGTSVATCTSFTSYSDVNERQRWRHWKTEMTSKVDIQDAIFSPWCGPSPPPAGLASPPARQLPVTVTSLEDRDVIIWRQRWRHSKTEMTSQEDIHDVTSSPWCGRSPPPAGPVLPPVRPWPVTMTSMEIRDDVTSHLGVVYLLLLQKQRRHLYVLDQL